MRLIKILPYGGKYGRMGFNMRGKQKGAVMYKKYEKATACILFTILIISLLPVIYLGRYNHPTGDDYYYGAETHVVWSETGSIAETMSEALKGVEYDYQTWQGTYSAMLLMRLAPNVFSEGAYKWVTCIMLLLLTGGIFFLLKPIVCSILKGSASLWVIAASILSLLCVQTVPTQSETFFWYNGAMYYTGYFAVTLFLFGWIVRYLLTPHLYYLPLFVVLAAFLAGGNYVSLLPALLLLICLTVFLFYRHETGRAWVIGATALVMIIGLAVSALAPGNSVRQSDMWRIPAWKAILKSLLQGIRYVWAWLRGCWLLAALVLTPFLWKNVKQVTWRFRYPVIVIGFVYGIFCSMSCPTFYTMNSTGPARAVAIVYYSFMLATFFCYYYLLGWIRQRLLPRWSRQNKTSREEGICQAKPAIGELWRVTGGKKKICMTAVSLIGVLLLLVQGITGQFAFCTTIKAVNVLASGEARAYEQEYRERLQLLTDESIAEVVLKPFENRPDMLYVGDLAADPDEPTNRKVAQYFGKKSVSVGE